MHKITSTYAILDVKVGRKKLAQIIYVKKIPVVIHGFITHQSSRDDGTSIEFGVDVTKLELPDA